MQIARNTVVSLTYKVTDEAGNLLDQAAEPISYLHGGYNGIFPAIEEALQGKETGYNATLRLTPEDAFGEYEAELVRVEPRDIFPVKDIQVGMQFEGSPDESDEILVYTVTEVTDKTVTVDGNHPLAGKVLDFACTVTEVRAASEEELAHGHVHGPHGHHH